MLISCSPGSNSIFLSSLSSWTKPRYCPSTQTPDVLSALVLPTSCTSPRSWFWASDEVQRIRPQKTNENVILRNTPIIMNRPPVLHFSESGIVLERSAFHGNAFALHSNRNSQRRRERNGSLSSDWKPCTPI